MLSRLGHIANVVSEDVVSARDSFREYIKRVRPGYFFNWHHDVIISYLERFARKEIRRLMVFMPPQCGKALEVSTPIPTLDGWKRIDELRVGDQVFGTDGFPCRVVAVSPVWQNRLLYAVKTLDGDEILADSEHEWVACDGTWKTSELAERKCQTLIKSPKRLKSLYSRGLPESLFSAVRSVSVTKTERTGDTVCIQVDSSDHMFLCGCSMLPTHNSELVSRLLPGYLLGRNPDAALMCCTYNDAWAGRFNRDVQRLIDSIEYQTIFPEVRLWSKNVRTMAKGGSWLRNSDVFEVVERKGVYRSAGVGSGIAGQPFDFGVVDDIIKDAKQANSPTMRESHDEWYSSVFHARQSKNASILFTITRWNDDDLAGRLLRRAKVNPEADQWTVIRFPALAEDGPEKMPEDKRQPGEPLWPSKYDAKHVAATRAGLSSYLFSAVHQQNPKPAKGGIFQSGHFRYFDVETTSQGLMIVIKHGNGFLYLKVADCRFYQTIDTALKEKQSSNFTAIGTWALHSSGRLFLWHVWRFRLEVPKQFKTIKALRHGPRISGNPEMWPDWSEIQNACEAWPHEVLFQAVEEKGSGIGLIQQGVAEGYPLKPLKADIDKVQRSAAISTMYENGMVYHRSAAAWLADYEYELERFPTGEFDDQVDIASYSGILATHDKILKLGWADDSLAYPQDGDQGDREEVYTVGDTQVVFPEEGDRWYER